MSFLLAIYAFLGIESYVFWDMLSALNSTSAEAVNKILVHAPHTTKR